MRPFGPEFALLRLTTIDSVAPVRSSPFRLHLHPPPQSPSPSEVPIGPTVNAYMFPSSIPIPSWSPTSLVPPLAPPGGDAHALAYHQHNNNIIIAFHGTQLNNQQDGSLHRHAPLGRSGVRIFAAPMLHLHILNPQYFSWTLNFTHGVMEAYPGYQLLLTSHSLGAGLAILVFAALWEISTVTIPVIRFGAPSTKKPLQTRSLSLRAADEGKVFVISNEWDEVMSQWDGQIGILCLYQTIEPKACSTYFSHGYMNSPLFLNIHSKNTCVEEGQGSSMLPVGDCRTCCMETHVLKGLIALAKEGK